MRWLEADAGETVTLPSPPGTRPPGHVFERSEVDAVNTAVAAGRPLLLRGEPGVGKSQLAKAAAFRMKRAFVSFVVDARTEASDLLWHFDAVARLAEAQLLAALGEADRDRRHVRDRLKIENFIEPRALWWSFDWGGARDQVEALREHRSAHPLGPGDDGLPLSSHWAEAGCHPDEGTVVLIDEIDKGEADVPNGLLEALGSREFRPPSLPSVVAKADPLVMITTNNERALPDAFVRRCLVLHMELPRVPSKLRAHLVRRGRAHFDNASELADSVLRYAAKLVVDDRERARADNLLPLPGLAEYIDLLRVLRERACGDAAEQRRLLKRVSAFALKKQVDPQA